MCYNEAEKYSRFEKFEISIKVETYEKNIQTSKYVSFYLLRAVRASTHSNVHKVSALLSLELSGQYRDCTIVS